MAAVIGALRVNLGIDSAAFDAGLKSAQVKLAAAGKAMGRIGAAAGAALQMKNMGSVANQVADIAVMLQGGSSVAKTLSYQLPQILASFGALGAVLGAAVAIGIPVFTSVLAALGGQTKSTEDQLSDLGKAVARVDDVMALARKGPDGLTERYGEVSKATRTLVRDLADAAIAQAKAQAATVTGDLRPYTAGGAIASANRTLTSALAEVGGYQGSETVDRIKQDMAALNDGTARMVLELKLGVDASRELQGYLIDGTTNASIEARVASLTKARDMLHAQAEALRAQGPGYADAAAKAEALNGQIAEIEDALRAADTEAGRLNDTVGESVRPINAAAAAARDLADAFARATSAAAGMAASAAQALRDSQLRLQFKGDGVGLEGALAGAHFDDATGMTGKERDDIPSIAIQTELARQRAQVIADSEQAARNAKELQDYLAAEAKLVSPGGRGGSAGGRSPSAEKANQDAKAYQRVIESLQAEKAAIGQTDLVRRQSEEVRAADVDWASKQGETIRGLVADIDAASEAHQRLEAAQKFFADEAANLFEAATHGAKALKNAIGEVIGQLGKMAISKGFTTLFNGLGESSGNGGSGAFDAIVRGLGALVGIPGFASGTSSAPGGLARINELGGEIVNLPKGAQVIPHDLSRRMVDGMGSGDGPRAIAVSVSGARGNAEIETMVHRGIAAALRDYDARLPDRVSRIGADPRFRG